MGVLKQQHYAVNISEHKLIAVSLKEIMEPNYVGTLVQLLNRFLVSIEFALTI